MASGSSATHTATTTSSTSKSNPGPSTVYETFTISGSAPSTTTRIVTADSTQTSLLGPLTTTFTAPSRCNQAYWLSASNHVYDPTIGQVCATVDGEIAYSQDSACLPPVKSTLLGSLVGSSDVIYTTYDYQGYYSPGIACPAGYSTACAAQAGADGIQSALSNFQSFGFVYTATADETVVGCCPTGYQCTAILSSQWCQHVIASTTQPVITCFNGTHGALASSTTQFTLPTNVTLSYSDTLLSTEVTSTVTLTTLTMLATMIQMNFQATDLASTSSPLSTSLPATTPVTTPTSTGDTTSSSSNNHKTTTIAVSVVIPCVAVLIAASLIWFWYRRRAKKQLSTSYQAAQSTEPSDSYYGAGTTSEPSEMVGTPARVEMEGSPVMYEMAGTEPRTVTTVRHEMYAGK